MKPFSTPPRLLKFVFRIAVILIVWMSLMRLGFLFLFNHQGFGIKALSEAFFLGLRFDLRIVGVVSLTMFTLGSLSILHPYKSSFSGRVWLWIIGLLLILINFFYTLDFAHYAYLAQRLNAGVLSYLEDAGISTEMVWQSYPVIRLLLLVFGLTAILYWFIARQYRALLAQSTKVTPKSRYIWSIGAFMLWAFLIFGRFNQYPLRWSDAYGLGSDYQANLALNPFESFFNTLSYRGSSYDEKKVQEAYTNLAPYFGWDVPDFGWDVPGKMESDYSRSIDADTTTARPNIVLVICESFSAYKSSMWGNPLNTTPFFDSLSKQGLFFDHCFSPSYGTARGVWATLTGLPDVESQQTASRNPSAVDQQTIMNQYNGYEKYYFIGGSPSWANIRGLLMNNIRGLHLYDQETLDAPRLDVWGISDKNLFLEANKILRKEQKPFFAIIQTADNHRPYSIPAEDTDFEVMRPSETLLNQSGFKDQVSLENKWKEYNAFRYTDYTFKKFIEAAKQEGYFKNTLFVFVGDHGIPGDVGTMLPRAWTDHRLACMHLPLLFYGPSFVAAKRENRICSQLDVMPTIAGITKQPVRLTTLGRNLMDSATMRNPFAFIYDPDNRQTGIIRDNYLYKRHLQNGEETLVSISNTKTIDSSILTKSSMKELFQLNEGFYQTAAYLLLHNKKRK